MPEPQLEEICWRGIRLCHPTEWEPALLSGPEKDPCCILVDRRYQRLQLQWQRLARPPDLERMFRDLQSKDEQRRSAWLSGVGGWTGLVREDEKGTLVRAGRFFEDANLLVQAVLPWPGARDRRLERAVLDSVRPLEQGETVLWKALGLWARVPAEYELSSSASPVGRVTWEFRRAGRPRAGLRIERIAMSRYWLKGSLEEWLAGQVPAEFRVLRQVGADSAGHGGWELLARRRGLRNRLTETGVYRIERAWSCPEQDRVYRLSFESHCSGRIDWPEGLEVRCCRVVRPTSRLA